MCRRSPLQPFYLYAPPWKSQIRTFWESSPLPNLWLFRVKVWTARKTVLLWHIYRVQSHYFEYFQSINSGILWLHLHQEFSHSTIAKLVLLPWNCSNHQWQGIVALYLVQFLKIILRAILIFSSFQCKAWKAWKVFFLQLQGT